MRNVAWECSVKGITRESPSDCRHLLWDKVSCRERCNGYCNAVRFITIHYDEYIDIAGVAEALSERIRAASAVAESEGKE